MSDVLVIGATGWIGGQIVEELHRRGHTVVAGVRTGGSAPAADRVVELDPRDAASIAAAARGTDAVVSALGRGTTGDTRVAAESASALLTGTADAGVERLVAVGGAGSLVDEGRRVVDSPDFPEAWKAGSLSQVDALEVYRAYEGPVDWAFVSPSDVIEQGEPTGDVELGGDELLRGADGESRVTTGDFVAALVDEVERPTVHRARFTVRTR